MGLTDIELEQLLGAGAIKLEITAGLATWEASPSIGHQRALAKIQASIEPLPGSDEGCACAHYSDIYIRFKDGSLKRPDIAIFCEEPPNTYEALTVIPQAIIEIVSPGYEYKDITLNPQFYLAQDVDDVVVVDPRSGVVTHYRTTGVAIHQAPVTLQLQCGCQCTVPAVEGEG
jgi:Uma2 family endonuclease